MNSDTEAVKSEINDLCALVMESTNYDLVLIRCASTFDSAILKYNLASLQFGLCEPSI